MTETATTPEVDYEEEASKMAELLKYQGWCPLRCAALGGDLVILVRDDPPMLTGQKERMMLRLERLKEPYTVYTLTEFDILYENTNPRLLHEAKKAGATILPP